MADPKDGPPRPASGVKWTTRPVQVVAREVRRLQAIPTLPGEAFVEEEGRRTMQEIDPRAALEALVASERAQREREERAARDAAEREARARREAERAQAPPPQEPVYEVVRPRIEMPPEAPSSRTGRVAWSTVASAGPAPSSASSSASSSSAVSVRAERLSRPPQPRAPSSGQRVPLSGPQVPYEELPAERERSAMREWGLVLAEEAMEYPAPERVERPGHNDRLERSDRNDRQDRPERIERPERYERSDLGPVRAFPMNSPGLQTDLRMYILRAPDSEQAAAFRVLRYRVEQAPGAPVVMALCAARAGQGATTAALNLAMALSECNRARVCLVEANLRRPSLARLLQIKPPMCLADRLARDRDQPMAPWDVAEVAPNLHVLALREDTPPQALVDGPAFSSCIAALRKEGYRHILVDGPEVLGIADMNLVEEYVDRVMLVARSGVTEAGDLRVAVGQLAAQKLFGVVLLDGE